MKQARGGFVYSTIFDTDVSNASFRLYVLLTTYADKDDICWPSNETLAEELRVTVRRIEQMMAELVRLNLVTREPGKNHWSPWITRVVRDPDSSGGTRTSASGGTRTPPSGRTNHKNKPREQTKEHRAPAGRGEGSSVRPVRLPEEPEDSRPQFERAPKEGTHKWLVYQFSLLCREHIGGGFSPGPLHRTFKELRQRGYSNAEIYELVEIFFVRHEQTIKSRANDSDVAHQFRGMVPRLERQAEDLLYDFERKDARATA